jgi:lysophospholipase L1-like esterase
MAGRARAELNEAARQVRVIEDCLNGRRTVWEDPFKAGRNGIVGLAQRIEIHSPLALVILMLGTNDFQSVHPHDIWHSAQGIASLIGAIRQAPIEPGMPVPPILVVAPPPIRNPRGPLARKFSNAEGEIRRSRRGLPGNRQRPRRPLLRRRQRHAIGSAVDGIHLDAAACVLGTALAAAVAPLLPARTAA